MLIAEERRSGSRYVIEPATPADDAGLRDLFRRTSMGSGIEVSFEREPSYFQALAIQGHRHEVGVIRDRPTGRIIGSGTRIMRKGFINGQETEVGYLGDLRIDPEYRNRTLTARLYRSLQARDAWCEWYYTVVFEENILALNTIAKGRGGLPVYHDCGRVLCPGIELRRKLPRISVPGIIIRQATDDDLPHIVDCLNRNLARKQFAAVHKAEHFQRGDRWRGLKTEDFFVAEQGGKITGIVAGWDQSSFKQTRIVRYHGRWKWLGPLSQWVAPIRQAPGLPLPGECLSYFYACCIAVDHDNLEVFRALLRQLYNAHVGHEWLYFMVGLHERDPLVPALKEYAQIPFAGRLFAVTLADDGNPPRALDSRIPSVEIATL